ncbi:hypothetical protein L910_2808 [Vibrio fluvialis PG41]|uniref:Uncharacterized protein n=1 Tax=Vibrio fluvialis PG41 TaxID=1336752 RepID=S7HVJ2_VIBFL|nr:hypothetical protein [Vibrio fluvialis]EPP19734.1 hypothetical protein L910_2808 [Vibrio fluvialis PG41]
MTIKNKEQFANCVRSLQKDVNLQAGTTIKLSVIREALAHALEQKSSNGLLSVLPISLCVPSLPARLHKSLMELAGVSYRTSLSTFPYPSGLELSQSEIMEILQSAPKPKFKEEDASYLMMMAVDSGFKYLITGDVSIIPNGDGTWSSPDKSNLKLLRLLLGDERVSYIPNTHNISASKFKDIYSKLYQPFSECIKSRDLWQQVENSIISSLGNENIMLEDGGLFTITPQNFDITVMELLQLNLVSVVTGEPINQKALGCISVGFINDLLINKKYADRDFYIENVWKPILGDKFELISYDNYEKVCSDDIWSKESKQAINELFLTICKANNWLSKPISSIVIPRFNDDIQTQCYRFELADESFYCKQTIDEVELISKPYARSTVLDYLEGEILVESAEIEEKISEIELEYQEAQSELDGIDEDDDIYYFEDPSDARYEKLSKLPIPLNVPRIYNVEAKLSKKAIVSGTAFDLSEADGYLGYYYDYMDMFTNDFCYLSNAAKQFNDLRSAESIFVLGSFSYSNINDFQKCLDEIVKFHMVDFIVIDIDFIKGVFPAYPHKSFAGLDNKLQSKVDELFHCIESNFEVSEYTLGIQKSDPIFNAGIY